MKCKIAKNICMSMVGCFNAKEFLESIEKQFKSSDKALIGIVMGTLTTKKYNGTTSIREYILEMSNLVEQLKYMDMIISRCFFVAICS